MSLQTILPWVLVVMLTSTLAMVFGVSRDAPMMTLAAAAAFAIFMIAIAFVTNRPYWRRTGARGDARMDAIDEEAVAARRNARLMATTYNWGGIALLAIYTLTSLRWQHGWQYALGMIALGAVCFAIAIMIGQSTGGRLAKTLRIAAMLTAIQGVLTGCGLVYLIGSGKLSTLRSDWAANEVFLVGGITLMALSAMALRTYKALKPE